MSEGWIKLHRQLQDNPIWKSEAFTRGQAWVDLILLANHEPGFIYVRDHKIDLNRGDVGWSQNRLSKRWKWSRTKVRKFLDDLEKEQQIKQVKSHSYTTIRLINYKEYQKKQDEKTTEEQQKDNRKTTERQQKDTNKNVKNVNNDKNIGKQVARVPTISEVREYFESKGYDQDLANRFFNYYNEPMLDRNGRVWKDQNGKTVKSWKQKALAVWFKDENKIHNKPKIVSLKGAFR